VLIRDVFAAQPGESQAKNTKELKSYRLGNREETGQVVRVSSFSATQLNRVAWRRLAE